MHKNISDLISTIKGKLLFYRFLYFVKLHQIFGTTDLRNYHYRVEVNGLRLSIKGQSQEEYLKAKKKELKQLQKQCKPDEFIAQAIRASRKCQFICFNCKDPGRFLQFWLADRNLYGSWPLAEGNNLAQSTLAMLGVLNQLNITQNRRVVGELWPFKYSVYYQKISYDIFDEYVIYFGKDAELLGEFANRVVTEVFGEKLEDLTFRLG